MKLVGLDIGTTTICGLVVDAGSGEILSVVTRPNASRIPGAQAWEALQDPGVILAAVREILDGFLGRGQDIGGIGGIGVAGQMHGILYVDRSGKAVSPLYTWQDGRGDLVDAHGTSAATRLSQSLGSRVSTGYGIVTHFYNAAHGLVPRGAASLCTIPDYVAMTICGRAAPLLDASNAASLGGFDLAVRDFRRSGMDSLGIDARLFPAVTDCFPALGEARPGVPVFAAAGDNQASFLGSVRDARATVLFNVGTGSQVSVPVDTTAEIPGLDVRPFPFGGYLAVGAALCGGRAYALLRTFFERTLRLFAPGESSVSWDTMNATTGPGLSVDTRFSGTRADPSIRGSIAGIGPDTFTPEHLIVGVREGIAAELIGCYQGVPSARRAQVSSMAGSGNGLRLSPALRGVFEQRLGMRMQVPAHAEETSFGAALIAGVASGALADLTAAGRLVRYE
jgi:sedoheptulokinase